MAKARAIIKRRKAVKNISKITKTMYMIASSRFQRAFKRAVASRPYTDKLNELLVDLASTGLEYSHPLLEKHEQPKRTTVLVITSNRGLCGGYNGNILREAVAVVQAEQADGREVIIDVVGKRGINFLRFTKRACRNTWTRFEDKPRFEEVEPIANAYIEEYSAGKTDKVIVVYMKFHSAGRQKATAVQLLPLQTAAPTTGETGKFAVGPSVDYIFHPDAAAQLDELIPQALKVSQFQGFLDAAVSEQVARMTAMKAATDNANDLVQILTRRYNRARQSQITTELSEIMGGAAAIKG